MHWVWLLLIAVVVWYFLHQRYRLSRGCITFTEPAGAQRFI
jgi:hypothetical protein